MALNSCSLHNEWMNTPLSFSGELLAIAVAPHAKAPLENRESAEIAEEKGILGDRYAAGLGAGQKGRIKTEQHVTLISAEAIQAASEESGLPLTHLMTRRNLLVRGVPLADLISKRFQIGEVVLFGFEDCAPCGYLEKMTLPGIKQALHKRGGLRAVVVSGGVINVGDVVQPAPREIPAAKDVSKTAG
jgi:MOSC domain-containing protein YiiM